MDIPKFQVPLKVSGFKLQTLALAIIVAVIWSIVISNYATQISLWPIWLQFFLVTISGYTIPSYLLGSYHGGTIPQKIKKIIGYTFFIASADLLYPPLAVNLNGQVSTASSILLVNSSVDIFFASIFQGLIHGPLLFIIVYPVMFFILFFISILLLTDSQLRSVIRTV